MIEKNILQTQKKFAGQKKFENYLASFLNFEKLPKKNLFWLSNMEKLCALFSHPEKSFRCFHVAGSKGKGSVANFLASLANEKGLKTGLYTSPHLLDFRERITDGKNFFPNAIYKRSADELFSTLEKNKKNFSRPLTWFELVTLYAFLCFRNARVELAVLEVGMGGRLDATNVVLPIASLITKIELEHTEFLGNTLEKIAGEKAGIIKKHIPVFVACQSSEKVNKVFINRAKENDSPIFFVDKFGKILDCDFEKTKMNLRLQSKIFSFDIFAKLKMLGKVQAENALHASLAFKYIFPETNKKIFERALSNARLPARFQIENFLWKQKNVKIIFDGAHTVSSVASNLETFKKVFPKKKYALLFSCASDKDVFHIARLFENTKIILTLPGYEKKSDTKKMIAAFTEAQKNFSFEKNIKKAFLLSLENAQKMNSPLLVIGSFYLVSEIFKIKQALAEHDEKCL